MANEIYELESIKDIWEKVPARCRDKCLEEIKKIFQSYSKFGLEFNQTLRGRFLENGEFIVSLGSELKKARNG